MKTNSLPDKGTIVFKAKPKPAHDNLMKKQVEERQKEQAIADVKAENRKVLNELKERSSHLDSVKKHIAENIQWREMRFRRHEDQGEFVVDIIDKATGEVIRSIPEKEFQAVNSRLKQYSGYNINISG